MDVVILVPRREDDGWRDRVWAHCRSWWRREFPDWPLVEGHHDVGPFNRSAALNAAATLAGAWDVAVIVDADILIHPPSVHRAVEIAASTGRMTVAFEIRRDLTKYGTERIVDGYTGPWEPFIRRNWGGPGDSDHNQHSSVIAVPRALWDDIGGFDEGCSGWGLEDTCFAIDCEVMAGAPIERVWGADCWHLWHPTNRAEKHGSPTHAANMARRDRHFAAHARGDRDAVRALVAEGRDLEAARTADRIPRILHRVVPEHGPAIAETWWEAFGAMHPGWTLRTHRDPLDPADWPLISPVWPKVANGAQLADLVRLEALLRWGGFYVDQDVEPVRPLDALLGAEVVAAWEDERCIPNAVMGARPGHPLIRQALDDAMRLIRAGRSVWDAGPGVTTRLFRDDGRVLLLPPGSFYPVHYRDPERDAKLAAPPPEPWCYVRHHYWGSWLPADRQRVPAA